jgi:[pyruvate, water dikinase]-phosphate phosphotransferase / [pyruvate, water dikinase] kinase
MEMDKVKIIIVSDGTGETATSVARAAMIQFDNRDAYFTRYKNVRTSEQIEAIFEEAAIHHDIILYTIVSPDLRKVISDYSMKKHVPSLDLLGPVLTILSNFFHSEPTAIPGKLHKVDEEYFKRVAAMEFTLNHDDGKNYSSLHLCDIVLLGISRTSKTPLSMYLSLNGIKVVNIPLVPGIDLPMELKSIDQRKIFGLTIDPVALHEIRQKRLNRLGQTNSSNDYGDMSKVMDEVEWANKIFKENKRWPVINVTGKAVEETAAEILKILDMRKETLNKLKNREK